MSFRKLNLWSIGISTALAACSHASSAPSTSTAASTVRAEKHVTLLHIADTHAQLESHPEYMPGEDPEIVTLGGYARLRTAFDKERAAARGAVFVADGGDTFQGSGPAAWSEGEVVLGPFNALGVDVCVPGNWEVVYGPQRFLNLMERVSCSVVAYNFHAKSNGQRLFAPMKTIERDGVRVTFVGIADPTTTERQPPEQVQGLDSTRMDGLRAFVQAARNSEKPDLVVAVTHTGLTVSRQIAKEIPELDVILSGHTHERTDHAVVEGDVIVVEPGSLGSFYGRLEVTLGADGNVAQHAFELVPVRASEFAEAPAVKRAVDAALAPHRARANEVVAHTETTLMRYDVLETTTDDFVTDAVREISGADIGLSNGFRYAPPVTPGQLTVGDLWNMLPLDARMKKGWVTGKELRGYLERELELVFSKDPWKLSGGWGVRASGMTFAFDARGEPGKRVRELRVAGNLVEDEKHYSIGGCERAGEPMDMICRFKGARDVEVLPVTVHQALRQYVAKHPHIALKREGRAVARDLPPRVFSQDKLLQEAAKGAHDEH